MDYFIINKPFGILSQFSKEAPEHKTLADIYSFPNDVYPIGRLDKDSEGLLILSNDKKLNHLLLHPQHGHRRTYWVLVEGIPDQKALESLRNGLEIRINKKIYRTKPANVSEFDFPPPVWERYPPIRFRAKIPTSWLQLELTEGKNRQVRRMCAKVGLPVLRLIRYSIEQLSIQNLDSGQVKTLKRKELYTLLNI